MISKLKHDGKVFIGVDPMNTTLPVNVVLKGLALELGNDIDTAAGHARGAFVSPGSYIDQEYLLAKQEATAWISAGKDQSEVPSSVQDHMAMFEVGAEEAANTIIETAEQWEQALATIRSARLRGKTVLGRAETIEEMEQVAAAAIAELDAIRPPEDAL